MSRTQEAQTRFVRWVDDVRAMMRAEGDYVPLSTDELRRARHLYEAGYEPLTAAGAIRSPLA